MGLDPYHELFLNLAKAFETRSQLEVMVRLGLGDGGDDSNPVPLGANVMGRRYAGDVDICLGWPVSQTMIIQEKIQNCVGTVVKLTVLAANLGLGDDQLARVAVIGVGKRVLEDADGAQDVARNLDLVLEVARVAKDHLGTGLELHLGLNTAHGSLDADGLASFVNNLVNVGVKHIGTAVDGAETSEALGKFAETVERVDVRRLSVSCNTVSIQTNAFDGLGGAARCIEVGVGLVESHGVADEILRRRLQTKLVIDILHSAGAHIEA